MNVEQILAHYDTIRSEHQDALTIAKSSGFLDWINRQPPMIQEAVQSGTAEDVIEVLTRYKTRNKSRFTSQQIERMSLEEFTQREKEIDEAVKAGTIT